MLLGTPVVASKVGGTTCLLTHGKDGYVYQADAEYMLAYYIMDIFGDKEKTVRFSKNARKHAMSTHNRQKNFKDLLLIYEHISQLCQ